MIISFPWFIHSFLSKSINNHDSQYSLHFFFCFLIYFFPSPTEKPSSMNISLSALTNKSLREFIRSVRAAKTAAEERAVISKEAAYIRSAFREDEKKTQAVNMSKLLFIFLMGYPAHFGQMESLKLIASPRYSDKRIGYLSLVLLLSEDSEVFLLIVNTIKNDIRDSDPYFPCPSSPPCYIDTLPVLRSPLLVISVVNLWLVIFSLMSLFVSNPPILLSKRRPACVWSLFWRRYLPIVIVFILARFLICLRMLFVNFLNWSLKKTTASSLAVCSLFPTPSL